MSIFGGSRWRRQCLDTEDERYSIQASNVKQVFAIDDSYNTKKKSSTPR